MYQEKKSWRKAIKLAAASSCIALLSACGGVWDTDNGYTKGNADPALRAKIETVQSPEDHVTLELPGDPKVIGTFVRI